jgi:hypothetical protein
VNVTTAVDSKKSCAVSIDEITGNNTKIVALKKEEKRKRKILLLEQSVRSCSSQPFL